MNKKTKSNKIINKIKKVGVAILLLVLNIIGVANSIYAASVLDAGSANVHIVEDCGRLLTYKGVEIYGTYVEYTHEGISYPAYCMDKTVPGVETYTYDVTIRNVLQDVGLWRIITNGYPYKTCEELGVANRKEGFLATKQAVYCYLHGNKVEDYGAIGEAGQRTLNALRNIVNNAANSQETPIMSTISINKINDKWEQEEMDKDYVSKTYGISAGTTMENYTIKITNEKELEGIKITDMNNNERNEFAPNETFKVLIPIKSMTEEGSFTLEVEAKIKTNPVFHGMSQRAGTQDYALTTSNFEDGTGSLKDEYTKNETRIIIVKKDQETGEQLQGVEFELLNKDLEPVITNLKTDEDGKIVIENVIPDFYYLNETKTIEGYEIYPQLVKVELDLNQEVTITVNNKKEEKPEIETVKPIEKEEKKLPVTGM